MRVSAKAMWNSDLLTYVLIAMVLITVVLGTIKILSI